MRRPLIAAAAATLAFAAGPLAAQTQSNLYLPINNWTTPYVEHLIRAGVLRDLEALTRPLRRADVARAVAAADTTDLAPSVHAALSLLADELAERPDTVRWKIEGHVGALGASDASRWTVRPSADSAGLYPEAGAIFTLEMPHFAFVTHPRIENRLLYDTEYTGKKDRAIAGRNVEGYLTASWKYLDVFFGLADRNWGSPEVEGLLLSTSPYDYDHLFLRIGPRSLRLELLATQLNDLPFWGSDSVTTVYSSTLARRYLSVHRLVVTPSSRVAFSLSEAILYANSGGSPRSFEPWYLNPLNLWLLAQADDPSFTGNSLVAADVTWRAPGSLRLFAQLYLDDFQVDRRNPGDREPPGYGYTLSGTGGARRGELSWSAFYTRVTNLAYRTPANEEQYTMRNVGIARNHDDYDQLTFRLTGAPAPRAVVTGEVTYLRQGAGDIRLRYPPVSAYPATPTILSGVVERTLRVAAQASWTPRENVHLSADLGRHFVRNAGHVDGQNGDRWVWRLRADFHHRLSGPLSW